MSDLTPSELRAWAQSVVQDAAEFEKARSAAAARGEHLLAIPPNPDVVRGCRLGLGLPVQRPGVCLGDISVLAARGAYRCGYDGTLGTVHPTWKLGDACPNCGQPTEAAPEASEPEYRTYTVEGIQHRDGKNVLIYAGTSSGRAAEELKLAAASGKYRLFDYRWWDCGDSDGTFYEGDGKPSM